jgi:hypothetical protein
MALSLLPTTVELATLDDLDKMVTWVGVDSDVFKCLSASLGTVPNARVLSLTPQDILAKAMKSLRIPPPAGTTAGTVPDRELSAVEVIQLALLWRVARQAYGLPDVDMLAAVIVASATVLSVASTATGGATAAPAFSTSKKTKVSNVADQSDETEVDLMSQAELDQAYVYHVEVTGADPPPEAEPTPEQITVLRCKVVTRGEAPYADFSVLTPFGRRVQKHMKARAWLLQQDGTWRSQDIPGPPSFLSWAACWRVFRAVLFMLRYAGTLVSPGVKLVVTPACLEEYYEKIAKLNAEFPECWHLLVQAEDRCRAEMFERYRRLLTKAKVEGRIPMNLQFDTNQPWVGVFAHAARDDTYWNEHVIRPSQTFVARSGGRSMTRDFADDVNVSEAAKEAVHKQPPLPGQGQSKQASKRRKMRDNRNPASSSSATAPTPPSQGSRATGTGQTAQGQHPKKLGLTFITDRDGNELCFKFAKGQMGACPEPCPEYRTHACQFCLQHHINSVCRGGGGKAGAVPKGRGKGYRGK